MRLAEALKLRADLKLRMEELGNRLASNSKVQEGESPSEDPVALMAELDQVTGQMEELITRINYTNSVTKDADGRSISSMIAERDMLRSETQILRRFLESASDVVSRHSASEIRVRSTVEIPPLRRKVDSLSERCRVVDNRIQELNWTTDLI